MKEVDFDVVIEVAQKERRRLEKRYGILRDSLDGKCKESADQLIEELSWKNITASKHFGWCIFDNCEGLTGEPCAPHCYVLVHDGRSRIYLDVTATQFKNNLEHTVPEVILMRGKPYWFRDRKPSVKEMENISGY